jgi:hypothetical protein
MLLNVVVVKASKQARREKKKMERKKRKKKRERWVLVSGDIILRLVSCAIMLKTKVVG